MAADTFSGFALSHAISSLTSFGGRSLSCDEPISGGREHGYRLEIIQWMILDVGISRGTHHVRAEIANAERVTVGRGAHGAGCGDRPTGSSRVLDDDRLPKRTLHIFSDRSRNRVSTDPGRKRYD